MNAELEIVSGPHQGKKVEVKPGHVFTVGRQGPADLLLRQDAMLSNAHFALEWQAQDLRCRDLKSRFGTLVNDQRVTEAVVRDGDRIVAGTTTFVVRIVGQGAKSTPGGPLKERLTIEKPAVSPATEINPEGEPDQELARIHSWIIQALRRQPEPLYAILDAARDPLVLAQLLQGGEEYQSLYEGPTGEAMADFGPFLVRLPQESPFLGELIREAWGKSWGVYLTCTRSFKEVRRHLRHFLMVELPDGDEAFFRFYDPRVLRVLLPTYDPNQRKHFFGPIARFLMEGKTPDTLLTFASGEGQNDQQVYAFNRPTAAVGSHPTSRK